VKFSAVRKILCCAKVKHLRVPKVRSSALFVTINKILSKKYSLGVIFSS